MAKARGKKGSGPSRIKGQIELYEFTSEDERPAIAVYAFSKDKKVIEKVAVDETGYFKISAKALKAANKIAVGPDAEDVSEIPRDRLSMYRAATFKKDLLAKKVFTIAKTIWPGWHYTKYCVSGSVRHCRLWWPQLEWLWHKAIGNISEFKAFETLQSETLATTTTKTAIELASADSAQSVVTAWPLPWPMKCYPVCDGLVEVYLRKCCKVIGPDWGLPELPKKVSPRDWFCTWPPGTDNPVPCNIDPLESLGLFKDGALNERVLNAEDDRVALKTLTGSALTAHIEARSYLSPYIDCNPPTKIAEGPIGPDGKFNICWVGPWLLFTRGCFYEFAFVVKQVIEGETCTIYNGVAANKWFGWNDEKVLTSYLWKAISCRDEEPPIPPQAHPFILLQQIGLADSCRLETPMPKQWDRVLFPGFNAGLADPVSTPAAAKGVYKNRNWGGLLKLLYYFHEGLYGEVKYYRVSVIKSDGNGNPDTSATRKYLEPPTWRHFKQVSGSMAILNYSLGPHTVGGEPNLYEVPYDSDPNHDWLSGQYHAHLDTTKYANDRHLLTLEVFDASGTRFYSRDGSSPEPGDIEGTFNYLRWEECDPSFTFPVPWAGLTHMFWWDNRHAIAEIVDLRKDSQPSTDKCQFLEGNTAAPPQFSAGYRAYHPQGLFLLSHRLHWRRGLSNTWGNLTAPPWDPENRGVHSDPPYQSVQADFSTMLGPHSKCAFSLNLRVNVKTFDGIGTLNGYSSSDQAAFALELLP